MTPPRCGTGSWGWTGTGSARSGAAPRGCWKLLIKFCFIYYFCVHPSVRGEPSEELCRRINLCPVLCVWKTPRIILDPELQEPAALELWGTGLCPLTLALSCSCPSGTRPGCHMSPTAPSRAPSWLRSSWLIPTEGSVPSSAISIPSLRQDPSGICSHPSLPVQENLELHPPQKKPHPTEPLPARERLKLLHPGTASPKNRD